MSGFTGVMERILSWLFPATIASIRMREYSAGWVEGVRFNPNDLHREV